MDIAAYLERINYSGALSPTLATLRALHRAHLLAVPFENLDVILKRPIILDEAHLYDKIVTRRRGGFCYELNGLFAGLLRELGFDVQLYGGEVIINGKVSRADAHLTMLVQLDEPWLADVGFGDGFIEPLRLNETNLQIQDGRSFRLTREGNRYTVLERMSNDTEEGYRFELEPHRLADFAEICHWTASSPDSHFTRKRICTRATTGGRITLSEMKLIFTSNGTREEKLLANEQEYAQALYDYFGIVAEGKWNEAEIGSR